MLKQQNTPIAPEAELNQPSLEQMVRSRVIPQLLQLHDSGAVLPETDGLIDVLLVGGSGMEQASAAMQRGIGYETIMLSLLAPAARPEYIVGAGSLLLCHRHPGHVAPAQPDAALG